MHALARIGAFALTIAVLSHAVAASQNRPDLTGRVILHDTAEPIPGATVFIYTAAVRTGTNPYCPSCYPDCGKRAATDNDGSFRIESLDPQLIFRTLVVAEGYEPTFKTQVDPLKGPIEVEMKRHDPSRFQVDRAIRGRVFDPQGKPVVGATISPRGLAHDGLVFDSRSFADPVAITNERGEFLLTIEEGALCVERYAERRNFTPEQVQRRFGDSKTLTLSAIVAARGLVSRYVYDLEPNRDDIVIYMNEGVMVTGRVVDSGGRPVSGIEIGIAQERRFMGTFLGDYSIGTREDGRFELPNLPANDQLLIYGKMEALRDLGAIAARQFSSGRDGEVVDVGTLKVAAAHTVRGRVVLSDGEAVPPQTRLLLSRDRAWDSQTVELGADGSFEFRGVPAESVSVSITVRGYHMSLRNASLDLLNYHSLVGRIDGDLEDLMIVLEPGEVDRERLRALQNNPAGRRYPSAQPRTYPLHGADVE